MVTDGQVLQLRRFLQQGVSLAQAARMTLMDDKTARKYRDDQTLPSQRKKPRNYRTRKDPFEDVWEQVQQRLENEPRLQAKTLFDWLQDTYPGQFPDSTRRTFERRVAQWRALSGPGKEVIFEQVHHPGRLAASDFTVMNDLHVTIAGMRFDHTFFHCVLTHSNIESVSLCFSESFEALSEGIQKAFWEFGGVPQRHRTDSLSAAINNHSDRKILTARYAALMKHYGCQSERINVRCAHENGDVESSHGHLKNRIEQALLLRGSRNFESRQQYVHFVEGLIARANSNRQQRFLEEQQHLLHLPEHRLDTHDLVTGIRVTKSSVIRVRNNTYSVPSRLIGQKVDVKISAEWIEVTHQRTLVERMPRLIGNGVASINYRHVIDSLVRKPGAFENYKYREEMFPTSHFRMAYDWLLETHSPKVADKLYLKLLHLAAHESQDAVQDALRLKIQLGQPIEVEEIRSLVTQAAQIPPATKVEVELPCLSDFDVLLDHPDMEIVCDEPTREENASQENHFQDIQELDDRTDRPVSGTASAELSRSLPTSSPESGHGESESSGIPERTDDSGMRNETGRTNQTFDDSIEASFGQDLGDLRLETPPAECDTSIGDASRWNVSGSEGERVVVWETGLREESRLVCVGGAVDTSRSECSLHDMQPSGATVVDCQTGLAFTESAETTFEFRGFDHRRPRLCATKPGRDGSVVHATGGTLRTGECAVDEQSGIQQVGPNLQGCDDNRCCHRPISSSQRDHRVERAELPSGESQTVQNPLPENTRRFNFLNRISNCR